MSAMNAAKRKVFIARRGRPPLFGCAMSKAEIDKRHNDSKSSGAPVGRPPLKSQAMTNAERQKRWREKRKAMKKQKEMDFKA